MTSSLLSKPRAAVCFPGCGSHILTEAGVDAGLRALVDYELVAGISGGAGVGAAAVYGVKPAKLRTCLLWALTGDRVIDWNPFSGGIAAGDVVEDLIDEIVGKGVRLGDAPIPFVVGVHDVDSASPQYFDSRVEGHKGILVRELVSRSMAIPGVFPAKAMPSHMLGMYTPDIQLKVDGGVSDNTADHVFDSEPVPRIAVQLYDPAPPTRRIYQHQYLRQALALFDGMLHASSQLKSKRDDGFTLRVPRHGDGFDFSLTDVQMSLRYHTGYDAVRSQRDAILNHLSTRAAIERARRASP